MPFQFMVLKCSCSLGTLPFEVTARAKGRVFGSLGHVALLSVEAVAAEYRNEAFLWFLVCDTDA